MAGTTLAVLWLFLFISSVYVGQCRNDRRSYGTRLQACNYGIALGRVMNTDLRQADALMERFIVHAEMGDGVRAKADANEAISRSNSGLPLTLDQTLRMIEVYVGLPETKDDDATVNLSRDVNRLPKSSPAHRVWLDLLVEKQEAAKLAGTGSQRR